MTNFEAEGYLEVAAGKVAGLSGRWQRLRGAACVEENAVLLAEFKKSSKRPPCGTARQRRRGIFTLSQRSDYYCYRSPRLDRTKREEPAAAEEAARRAAEEVRGKLFGGHAK